MRRIMAFSALFLFLFAGVASASVFGDVWNGIKEQAIGVILGGVALGLNGVLGWLHRKNAARFNVIAKTMVEAGEFMYTLGSSVGDAKVSREEIAKTLKEGKDVINIYRPTPAKYQGGLVSADPNAPPLVKPQ